MSATPAEMMKEYVNSQNFSSTTEVMAAMKEMFKDVLQQVMESELENKLGYEKSERISDNDEKAVSKNYRNGYSKKTIKSQLGEVQVKIPRDRNGEYEPQIIEKYSRNADGMEEKILSLYSCGMSQCDIAEQIKSLYDVEMSPELVSKISEKIMPEVTAWQNRPLETVYPFVFMDAIHYKVKENHQIVTKAAYVVLGITMDGNKDILGIWIGEHESSKFWLSVLNDLKSRGVLDVYLFCIDGLKGFQEAISAAYPKAQIQRCIIHQIRYSTRYVSYKDIKQMWAALDGVVTNLQRDLLHEVLHVIDEQTQQIARAEVLIQKYMDEEFARAAVAIDELPGIAQISAQQIVAEIGIDMNRFPTADHLCSWAGICPETMKALENVKAEKQTKETKC